MPSIGRVEFRDNNDGFWVASYRLPNPDGHSEPMEVARIRITLVDTQERRLAFQRLVTEAIDGLVKEAGGPRPTWIETARVMG